MSAQPLGEVGSLTHLYPLGWAQLALYHRGPDHDTALPVVDPQAVASPFVGRRRQAEPGAGEQLAERRDAELAASWRTSSATIRSEERVGKLVSCRFAIEGATTGGARTDLSASSCEADGKATRDRCIAESVSRMRASSNRGARNDRQSRRDPLARRR